MSLSTSIAVAYASQSQALSSNQNTMQTECGMEMKNLSGVKIHESRCKECFSLKAGSAPEDKQESKIDGEVSQLEKPVEAEVNYQLYKQLPPPLVDHLELTFGAWLREFEVGQVYRQDFGGMALYIKVPEKYSTEWRREQRLKYDNRTRRPAIDASGQEIVLNIVTPDVRWKGVMPIEDCKKWISLVKEKIITDAYNKGLQLPNTQTPIEETRKTMEDYRKAVHR